MHSCIHTNILEYEEGEESQPVCCITVDNNFLMNVCLNEGSYTLKAIIGHEYIKKFIFRFISWYKISDSVPLSFNFYTS